MIFPTPIYRFFSKEKYADELVFEGKMRFTPTTAFADHIDPNYKDEGEKYYRIKIINQEKTKVGEKEIIESGTIHHTHRRIEDAWAFCCTTSIVSTARKQHATYIKNLGRLWKGMQNSIQKQFGEELTIMFGPVAYYDYNLDAFSEVIVPPYFAKDEKFKTDLEFRIVIIPSASIYSKGRLTPIELIIDNPKELFGKTLIPYIQK